MIEGMNPGFILIFGALLVPLTSSFIRSILLLALPVLALAQLYALGLGVWGEVEFLGLSIEMTRVDKLSRIFGTIFCIAALIGIIYSLHVKDTLQHFAALIYMGSALGAVFAGDLITLFVFWELTAVTSVFLIWASRTERAFNAGIRYLIIQVTSGVTLLGGVILYYQDTGSIAFEYIGLGSLAGGLVLAAFGIKACFPFLHNWMQDAYPEGTVTGTVILSAFTTKLAIYALARAFPGTEILIPIGVVMAIFPLIYVVLENDLRRVLAYSLNSQLGFMVIGVGIGTELALNGTAAHAFIHILYKSLLFMCMGAVLFRTGTMKTSELGGLFRSMPVTMVFCLIGAMSIAGLPLTGGFVSKAMIMSAAKDYGIVIIWLVLLFARAGVMDHAGIKVPFFTFFGQDRGLRVKEAPFNMLLAMGIAAFLCLFTGAYPAFLYSLLPYEPTYDAYTAGHMLTAVQILVFAGLGFALLMRFRIYPLEQPATILDFDWVYRRGLKMLAVKLGQGILVVWGWGLGLANRLLGLVIDSAARTHGDGKFMARTASSGRSIALIVAILGIVVVFLYQ